MKTDTLPGSNWLYLPLSCTGTCVGVLAVNHNKKSIDLEEKRFMEALGSQVALALERVRAEREIDRTQVAAEKEKLRSSLLSSLSHDFRTPLAAVSGAAELLQREDLPAGSRKELTLTIAEESDRLSRMIRNVLDITKLESGSLKLKKDWHSLEEIVGAALERTRTVLSKHVVKVSIPPDFPLVAIDDLLIEQLLINLLENEARHTPPGTTVSISAGKDDQWVSLVIEDNGPGLVQGTESQVFEKHYTRSHQEGFGLGLFIVRGIVQAHGGEISASNRQEGGVKFTLRLPYIEPPKVEGL